MSIFNKLKALSIAGVPSPAPASNQTYNINTSAPIPPCTGYCYYSNGSGFFSFQKASWSLIDSNQNILQQAPWVLVNGSYVTNPIVTIPSSQGSYLIESVIYQYTKIWHPSNCSWDIIASGIVANESYSIQTSINVYALQNNVCNYITIPYINATSNDYSTLSACQGQIVETVYRLQPSTNQCSQLSILTSQQTANDYSTSVICQNQIIPGTTTTESPSWLSTILSSIGNWLQTIFPGIFGYTTT